MSDGWLARTSLDLSPSDSTLVVYGAGVVVGLLVLSYLLYMVDVWATDRIDGLLLAQYGPKLYHQYTSSLMTRVGEEEEEQLDIFTDWTEEDSIVRALLIAEEEQYRWLYCTVL